MRLLALIVALSSHSLTRSSRYLIVPTYYTNHPLEKQYCLALSEYPLFLEKMAKNTSTTYMTADDFDNDNSPEISEPTRKSSIRNPFKSLKHFKESEKSKQHTADPNFNEPPTSSSEQDTFHDLVRATQGMSPEQVKAFLATKSEADREKYKDDVRTSALVMARL